MSKVQQMILVFRFWLWVFRLPQIKMKQDNRQPECLTLDHWEVLNKTILLYNRQRIIHFPLFHILSDMFHEIGHLKYGLPYKTRAEKIEDEYRAELFSCQCMKHYYPKLYQQWLKYFKRTRYLNWYKKHDSIYYEAFKRIPDYVK